MTMHRLPAQRGATLIVGLIMLAVITLMVASAFSLSATNLKSVGNMQQRNEAIAAANRAIEQVVGSPFTNPPLAQQQIAVDMNNDGNIDYQVMVAAPSCIRAVPVVSPSSSGRASSISLGITPAAPSYNTVWELQATVTDAASGATATVHQGVRKLLTQTQYNAVCP
jgi:hypothetical protein